MQLRSYSSRPAASAADSEVSSAACAGANTEYRAPVSTSAVMRPAGLPSASPDAAGMASDCGLWVDTGSLADQVDRGEEPDPHDVDEVPVVGDHDRRGRLRRREPAHGGPDEHEHEGDQATDDVQRVEPRRQVEDRAVGGRRDAGAVLGDQHAVLVGLATDEHRAHEEGDREPAPQAVDVAALRGEY